MTNIFNIDDYIHHVVSELICIKCGKRIISCRPRELFLKKIECEKCGSGYMIETGQILLEENA